MVTFKKTTRFSLRDLVFVSLQDGWTEFLPQQDFLPYSKRTMCCRTKGKLYTPSERGLRPSHRGLRAYQRCLMPRQSGLKSNHCGLWAAAKATKSATAREVILSL